MRPCCAVAGALAGLGAALALLIVLSAASANRPFAEVVGGQRHTRRRRANYPAPTPREDLSNLEKRRVHAAREGGEKQRGRLVEYVNVFAGSYPGHSAMSEGNTLPLVALPWGFNAWVVQTRLPPTDGFIFEPSGASPGLDAGGRLHGFRCTHQPSPWIGDYGYFLLTPLVGGPADAGEAARAAWRGYEYSELSVAPHRMGATLAAGSVPGGEGALRLELAPATHAAIATVTYLDDAARAGTRRLLLRFRLADYHVPSVLSVQRVGEAGVRVAVGGSACADEALCAEDYRLHIHLQFSQPVRHLLRVRADSGAQSEPDALSLGFESGAPQLTARVATSFIDGEYAARSLEAEVPHGATVDSVAAAAAARWEEVLGASTLDEVGAEPAAPRGRPARSARHERARAAHAEARAARRGEEARVVWYTAAYRAALFPRFLHELDAAGRPVHWSPYTGARPVPGVLVADSGFWDAYRTLYPWLGLAHAETLGRMVDGWLHAADELGGWVPQWASPGARSCALCHATMSDVTLADALVKRIGGFDERAALRTIVRDAEDGGGGEKRGRGASQALMARHGYLPADAHGESVSFSLNFYYADWAVAQAASALCERGVSPALACTANGSYPSLSAELERRAAQYPRLFERELGPPSFQPRGSGGGFVRQPMSVWGGGYTEGGPQQYRFYAPFNVSGLGALYGGRLCEAVQAALTRPFDGSSSLYYWGEIHEVTEARLVGDKGFGELAHNNQPTHHTLYTMLSADGGACAARARAWIRRVLRELYTPRGYAGDEDNGEMSAWFLLSASGLYPLRLATDELVLGAPLYARVSLRVRGGTLVVTRRPRERGETADALWVAADARQGAPPVELVRTASYAELVRAGGALTFLVDEADG